MTTWQFLTTTWEWEPTVLAGCALALLGYCLVARPCTGCAWLFGGGILALAIALLSPLDTLGDRYLFSAHMVQHLLLILIVPPLLVRGIPSDCWARLLRWAPAHTLERRLAQPICAWLLGILTLWIWHAPTLYDAALAYPAIHVVQHLTFLVTATIFWWPVLTPLAERRLSFPASIAYLVAAGFASSILGVIITFAPPGLYPAYQHPVGPSDIVRLVRDGWGLSYGLDQQVGGLIMWVTGGPVYLCAALVIMARWFGTPDAPDSSLTQQAAAAHTPRWEVRHNPSIQPQPSVGGSEARVSSRM